MPEWFRNTDWNDAIAAAFEQKLMRARDKTQYLRIQACTIAPFHPRVALALLDRYFALGEHFDHAQAHVDRATAYIALGDVESAIGAYEAALTRESVYPNLRTGARLELPYLIALNGIAARFAQAMHMLSGAADDLLFPVARFKHHAARALILASSDPAAARVEARAALEAAALQHSGLRYHPTAGLVTATDVDALTKLRGLLDA